MRLLDLLRLLRRLGERPGNGPTQRRGVPGDGYPFVMTGDRRTEHHAAGGMSRFVPYLAGLQPAMSVGVGTELAAVRGLEHGGWATVETERAAIEARVMV